MEFHKNQYILNSGLAIDFKIYNILLPLKAYCYDKPLAIYKFKFNEEKNYIQKDC